MKKIVSFSARVVLLTLLAGLAFGSLPAAADPCPADYNGSGQVTPEDVNAFLRIWYLLPKVDFDQNGVIGAADVTAFIFAYGSALPSADYNGDGVVTSADYTAFINDWSGVQGSPSTDLDGDGVVTGDTGDLFAFIDHYTHGC